MGESRAGSSVGWLSESLDRSSEEPRSLKQLSEMDKASFSQPDGSWWQTETADQTHHMALVAFTNL